MSDEDSEPRLPVTKATRKRLRTWKSKHDLTYDEAINTLLDKQENEGE